jgi:hypothetical protein
MLDNGVNRCNREVDKKVDASKQKGNAYAF